MMARITDTRDTAELEVSITHPSGGDGVRRVALRITDLASNLILADVTLTPEQFTNLLSTRMIHVSALIPDKAARGRLFKRREHAQHLVPAELGDKYAYRDDEAVTARIDAWVEQTRVDEGWDTARLALGSQTFYAAFERWVEDGA